MTPYAEHYARAKELLGRPEELTEELDRVLGAADPDRGERLEEAVRLAEMALAARLDPWWTGPPQTNIRRACARLDGSLADPLAVGLGVRLALGYARLGRVGDEAHRLATLCRRLAPTGLDHPESAYADEAARYLEKAAFLPSHEYTYDLVRGLEADEAFAVANTQLGRQNPSFAALLVELYFVRALDDWYVGPVLPNVERALRRYRSERPDALAELAVLLARSYVKGAFVDLRARDHVLAVLEGEEAHLLGPEEAIGFQEYVDRDCFDYPYEHSYARVKELDADELAAAVRRHVRNGALNAGQQLLEMALVRRLAPWRIGDPLVCLESAVDRYAAAGPGATPELDWPARYLAGLYIATLQGSRHARRLVHAVVGLQTTSPEFREAIDAAGIPGDVSVDELHRLYREVVEVEARVAAFGAEADAAGGLSDYERAAYAEVLEFLEADDPFILSGFTRTIGDLAEVVAPASLIRTVTAGVENVLRLAVSGTSRVLRRERILGQLARKDPALRSLERIREADLELLDETAWEITRENRIAAALEGFGCGLGGPSLVLVDLPALVLVNLNAVAAIATVYGYDLDEDGEREFAVALTAGGALALRQLAAAEAAEPADGSGEGRLRGAVRHHVAGNAALALHGAATRMATRLVKQKVLQLVPIVGGAVGAGINFHFTHVTTRTAVMAYRLRWLMRRVGVDLG